MPDIEDMTPGQVLAEASVADFIKALGLSIAEAQKALDENSVNQMGEFITPRDALGGKSLLDIGLMPAFYHYQHADITCSMQLSLRVEKNIGVGVNIGGSFEDTTTSESTDERSTETTSSGSSERTSERTAQVEVQSSSTGALTIGGRAFQLSGADPLARIRALQDAVTADPATGVPRLLYDPAPRTFTITTDADPDKVHTTSNTVAFLGMESDYAIIQIDTNAATDYVFNGSITVGTTPQADLSAYATHVDGLVTAQGYDTFLAAPSEPLMRVNFRTGRDHFEEFQIGGTRYNDGDRDRLRLIANLSNTRNLPITVTGHADAQQYPGGRPVSDVQNQELSERRARTIRDMLVRYGADPGRITVAGRGATEANDDVARGGSRDNVDFRRVDINIGSRSHWLRVRSTTAAQNMTGIAPDQRASGSTGNGFIYLESARALSLSGKKCTIDGTDFPFSGAAGGGHGSGSAEAYAENLKNAINGNASVDYEASAEGNVVTVFGKTAPFTLTLVTAESRQIELSGRDGVSVTSAFTRRTTTSATRQNTGNRTVAIGASVDVRYGRQFEMNVTGNSSISARLVSIPAPPQFLETIKDFLDTGSGG